jgi:hypothetical protein
MIGASSQFAVTRLQRNLTQGGQATTDLTGMTLSASEIDALLDGRD